LSPQLPGVARLRAAISRAAARASRARPTLSLCLITAGRPEQVRRLLELWRPVADEVFLALDERGPHEEIARAVGGLADRLAILPAMPGMERYLGWAHRQCTCDWILRVDDDELPSRALLETLPSLLAEREPTHYWLTRRWVYPSPREAIAHGLWERDIQVRLVRNVPGIWRTSGGTHSNIRVEGAGRVIEAALLHLVLLLGDVERRRAKADWYERMHPGITDDTGASINHVFVPEDVEDLRLAPMEPVDERSVAAFLADLDEERPPAGAPSAEVLQPTAEEIEQWNEDRSVPPGAYAARVRLVHPVRPIVAAAVHHVQVEVTNLGDTWWPRGPDARPELHVGHRWRTLEGAELELATPRTPFTEHVAPGATTRLTVAIQAPPQIGELELLVDVVHEWVRWFDCAATQRVTVTPPYDEMFFATMRSGARRSAYAVLPPLLEMVPARSLVDVGCGWGSWMRAALELGVEEVAGVDGEWVDRDDLEVPAEAFRQTDLARPLRFDRQYDLAISLEVAEHLPEQAAAGFVASLVGAAPVVAFSAAVPGQGGLGHLNEQWPAYWSEMFAQHGYECVDALRQLLWHDARVDWWYAQNLVIYAGPDALSRHPALAGHPQRGVVPLALVHPRRLAGEVGDLGLAKALAARVAALDTTLFGAIESQTTEHDRRSLLALHAAVADRGPFRYLEIGSHLGGSLQALVADPRCMEIVSIDTRPESQPDDRGEVFHYDANSTERMLRLLGKVPGADLSKILTFEEGTDVLSPSALPGTPALCLIDGEHTKEAALRDARFCLEALGDTGIIAFHDSNVVQPAIDDFVRSLGGRTHAAFQLPDSVAVVQVGAEDLPRSPFVRNALTLLRE
jgi:methyltransferase family protein